MKIRNVLALTYLVCTTAHATELPRSAPEAQGVSSPALRSFVEAIDQVDSPNSLMVLRHGHVVAEGWWAPYRPKARQMLYSLSKSFTSTAVGLAIAEGKLRLDDEVLKYFPDDAPSKPNGNLKSMRVSDLLRMSTGHQTEPPRKVDEAWTKTFLAHPVPFKPGTHFLYNTSATYMQSAIVQQVTGQTVLDYLRPRLFEPLGIENPAWETSPQGISTGGYGLSIRTEDIAKFGQLCLQKGKWHDRQLVPEDWIEEATSLQTSNGSNPQSDWDQGYGYQFWRCRHGAYRGDGAFGQYCIVMPEQDAVIAITSGVKDMQQILDLVWEHLLPALTPDSLPPNEVAAEELRERLQSLQVRFARGSSPPREFVGKVYRFAPNELKLETVSLEQAADDNASTLVLRVDGVDQRIVCGHDAWRDGRAAWGTMRDQQVGAAGGWKGDAYTAKICFYGSPIIVTMRLQFSPTKLTLNSEANVGFGPTKYPEVIGTAR